MRAADGSELDMTDWSLQWKRMIVKSKDFRVISAFAQEICIAKVKIRVLC